jgi:CelD/BcsL family acetyltransferase involved in cellulose biosynthesis
METEAEVDREDHDRQTASQRSPSLAAAPTAIRSQGQGSRAAPQRPGVAVVRDVAELRAFEQAWIELAAEALEPNVFHEPWMMLPAIRSYGSGKDLRFALVFTPGDPPTGPAVLAGFFQLERRTTYRGFPATTLSLWRYPHCFLGTPLIRRDAAAACLEAFFDWATGETAPTLLDLARVSGEGELHRLLIDQINRRGLFTFNAESYLRALFEPAPDADSYLRQALTGKKRKELRRQASRLSELGDLEFHALSEGSDVERWVDEFLRLEASGWKGEIGTALASTAQDRQFVRQIAREAFARGRLSMLALRLDGQAIAMKLNLLAEPGAFAIKVAFDERFARFSPGVCLEVENIRRLHQSGGTRWMDSCAEPGHPMIDRVWSGRRWIQSIVISTRPIGEPLVCALPFLRWLRHKLPRGPLPATPATAGGRP